MALVEHWSVDFDSDAETGKFFYSPAPGGLANIADVRRTTVDSVSCIEINIGNETPTVEYFSSASGDAYGKMVADVANQTNGAIAYCYSTDSTKHGRYVKSGGAWGARTGSVAGKLADDENHRRVAQIRLMLQSWSASDDPYAPSDSGGALVDKLGYPDFAILNPTVGLPAEDDLSGWVMRWRMRAIGMSMGRHTKICQHFQTRIPDMPLIGTYEGVGAVAFVNAVNQATCISDVLGFGGGGLYAPNTVAYQADSGWVDVDIPLEPLWSHWLMLGGNADKMGSEGAAYDKSLRYVVADPARWITNWTGNAYMLEAKFNTDPDADLAPIPVEESVRGKLLIASLSFLREA